MSKRIAPGMECDHDDGDGLNNQRENLFEVTRRGNGENRHHVKTSRYLGVCWCKRDKRWKAQIRVNGKKIHLGNHSDELSAAQSREIYILAHPELMARSNFPMKVKP
jgi:hypothetical protein